MLGIRNGINLHNLEEEDKLLSGDLDDTNLLEIMEVRIIKDLEGRFQQSRKP